MCNWYRTADSETAGGRPTMWYTDDGVQFMVAYIRCSGPSDAEIPRRVCVIKAHPSQAEREAMLTLDHIDPSCAIVSRSEAGVADARV